MTGPDFTRHLERLGLNQKEAALFFGVNRRTVWIWSESGCTNESAAKLLRIADRLGWPLDYLKAVSAGPA